jgi:hypothetical protein
LQKTIVMMDGDDLGCSGSNVVAETKKKKRGSTVLAQQQFNSQSPIEVWRRSFGTLPT